MHFKCFFFNKSAFSSGLVERKRVQSHASSSFSLNQKMFSLALFSRGLAYTLHTFKRYYLKISNKLQNLGMIFKFYAYEQRNKG